MTKVINCLYKNLTGDTGGAIFYNSDHDLCLCHSIFIYCTATGNGGGLYATINKIYLKSVCFSFCNAYVGLSYFLIANNYGIHKAEQISGFQTTYAPYTSFSFSIFSHCTSNKNGVLLQFNQDSDSFADHLIIKD